MDEDDNFAKQEQPPSKVKTFKKPQLDLKRFLPRNDEEPANQEDEEQEEELTLSSMEGNAISSLMNISNDEYLSWSLTPRTDLQYMVRSPVGIRSKKNDIIPVAIPQHVTTKEQTSIKSLTKENELLREQMDKLKKELSALNAQMDTCKADYDEKEKIMLKRIAELESKQFTLPDILNDPSHGFVRSPKNMNTNIVYEQLMRTQEEKEMWIQKNETLEAQLTDLERRLKLVSMNTQREHRRYDPRGQEVLESNNHLIAALRKQLRDKDSEIEKMKVDRIDMEGRLSRLQLQMRIDHPKPNKIEPTIGVLSRSNSTLGYYPEQLIVRPTSALSDHKIASICSNGSVRFTKDSRPSTQRKLPPTNQMKRASLLVRGKGNKSPTQQLHVMP